MNVTLPTLVIIANAHMTSALTRKIPLLESAMVTEIVIPALRSLVVLVPLHMLEYIAA